MAAKRVMRIGPLMASIYRALALNRSEYAAGGRYKLFKRRASVRPKQSSGFLALKHRSNRNRMNKQHPATEAAIAKSSKTGHCDGQNFRGVLVL